MRGKDGVYNPQPNFGWLPRTVKESMLQPGKMTVPSFASRQWLRDSGAALRRFIEYAESRWGRHVIGYHLVSGGSQEWYYWGAFEDAFADYSQPQQEAFARWLEERELVEGSHTADLPGTPIPSVDAHKL